MATIKDVANDAGVAVGTVSKVLNGHHVSAENKRKVEESVARLGYQMNYYARGLKTRYTYTVAVQELTARGSRKLLFIRSGSCLSSETLKRGEGFVAACKERGLTYEVMDSGDDAGGFNEEGIYDYLREHMMNGKLEFDGIYTSTDGLGIAVLEQMRRLDIQAPKDVQLIGHDGLRHLNRGAYLLSSIAQPVEDMACAAVESVIHLIRREPVKEMTVLPVTCVEGGTTRIME